MYIYHPTLGNAHRLVKADDGIQNAKQDQRLEKVPRDVAATGYIVLSALLTLLVVGASILMALG